eukprot:3732848-Pyramimonas_sp.AAC.2
MIAAIGYRFRTKDEEPFNELLAKGDALAYAMLSRFVLSLLTPIAVCSALTPARLHWQDMMLYVSAGGGIFQTTQTCLRTLSLIRLARDPGIFSLGACAIGSHLAQRSPGKAGGQRQSLLYCPLYYTVAAVLSTRDTCAPPHCMRQSPWA